LDALLL